MKRMKFPLYLFPLLLISGCFFKHEVQYITPAKKKSSVLVDLSGNSKDKIRKFIFDYSHLPIYVAIEPENFSEKELEELFLMKDKIEIIFADLTDYRYPVKAGFKDDILNKLYKYKFLYKKVSNSDFSSIFSPSFLNIPELKNIFLNIGIKNIFTKNFSTGKLQEIFVFSFSDFSYSEIPRYVYLKFDEGFKEKIDYIFDNAEISLLEVPGNNIESEEENIVFNEKEKEFFDVFKLVRNDVEDFKNRGNIDISVFSDVMDEVYFLERKMGFNYRSKAELFYSISRIYKKIGKKIPASIFDYYSKEEGFDFPEIEIKVDGRKEKEWDEANFFSLKDGLKFFWVQDKNNFYFLFNSTTSDFEIYFNSPLSSFYSFKDSTGNVLTNAYSHYLSKEKDKFLFYRANSDDTYSLISGLYDVRVSSSFLEFSIPQYFFRTEKGGVVRFNLKYENKFYPEGNFFFLKLNDEPNLVLRFFDPLFDSKGPGWYKIPTSTKYSYSELDIREFSVKEYSDFILFEVKMDKLDLDNTFLDIYIDLNRSLRKGSLSLLPGRNAYTDDYSCWEVAISFSKNKGKILRFELDEIKEIGEVNFGIIGNRIRFKVSRSILYGENLKDWGYIVVSGLTNNGGNVLEVKRDEDEKNPGGGRPEYGSPNIFDILEESQKMQKIVLSKYLRKQGVRLRAIRR